MTVSAQLYRKGVKGLSARSRTVLWCSAALGLALPALLVLWLFSANDKLAPGSISDDLDTIIKRNQTSYHLLLREVSRAVVERFSSKSWGEVSRYLDEQKLQPLYRDIRFSSFFCTYRARQRAYVTTSGLSHELQIKLRGARTWPVIDSKRVDNAEAGLFATVGRSLSALRSERPYPRGSVMDVVLASSAVGDEVRHHQNLESVWLAYGPIRDRHADSIPYGFHVDLTFADSTSQQVSRKKIFLTVRSALDPPVRWDRQPDANGVFKAEDKLGELRIWGSVSGSQP
jgi:hypothetical protein